VEGWQLAGPCIRRYLSGRIGRARREHESGGEGYVGIRESHPNVAKGATLGWGTRLLIYHEGERGLTKALLTA
jgi:hypothetical protein